MGINSCGHHDGGLDTSRTRISILACSVEGNLASSISRSSLGDVGRGSPSGWLGRFFPGTSPNQAPVSTQGSFPATADGSYYAVLNVFDSRYISDTKTPLCVQRPQTPNVCAYGDINTSAVKQGADNDKQTVTLSTSFLDVDPSCGTSKIQWQVLGANGVWADIPGANSKTFTYSNFLNDATPTLSGPTTINGDPYMLKTFVVTIRSHVTRDINGQKCAKDSAGQIVKMILAVDP